MSVFRVEVFPIKFLAKLTLSLGNIKYFCLNHNSCAIFLHEKKTQMFILDQGPVEIKIADFSGKFGIFLYFELVRFLAHRTLRDQYPVTDGTFIFESCIYKDIKNIEVSQLGNAAFVMWSRCRNALDIPENLKNGLFSLQIIMNQIFSFAC